MISLFDLVRNSEVFLFCKANKNVSNVKVLKIIVFFTCKSLHVLNLELYICKVEMK